MGAIFAYSLFSALLLAALYCPYKWLLARENRPALNRRVIMGIYCAALALPGLIRFAAAPEAAHTAVEIDALPAIMDVSPAAGDAVRVSVADAMLTVYIGGMLLASVMLLIVGLRIGMVLFHTRRAVIGGIAVRVSDDNRLSPFTFLKTIVLPRRDLDKDVTMILAHESVHRQCNHWADLIIGQIVCVFQWYNPASWLMLREMRSVHEFQADNCVISRGGDPRGYQMLLLEKAIGMRFPLLANSLNHSNIKNRITMMNSKSPKGLRRMRPLLLVPALGAAVWLTDSPAVASVMSAVSSAELPSFGGGAALMVQAPASEAASGFAAAEKLAAAECKVSETAAHVQTGGDGGGEKKEDVASAVQEMPEYPGGISALMKDLSAVLVYPEAAVRENREGRVVVQFVVDRSGRISDPVVVKSVSPDLDEAAVNAVLKLKPFNPGKIEGEPVAVHYSLPVQFKLQSDESEKAEKPVSVIKLDRHGNKAPAILVDGKLSDIDALSKINPNDIQEITVKKDNPDYPDGLLIVTLKK